MEDDTRTSSSTDVVRAVVVFALCAVPSFVAGAVVADIRQDFRFGDAALGLAFASFWGVAALSSAPAARVVRRIGPTVAVRVAGVIVAATCTALGLVVHSALALIAMMLVGGTAPALAAPAVNVILMRGVRPGRRAVAFGVAQSSPPLAILLAGLAVPGIATPLGWRAVYLCAAILALGGTLLIRRAPAPLAAVSSSATQSLRPLAVVMVGVTAANAALGALHAFLVASAPRAGVSHEAAAVILALGSGLSIAFRIALGARADRRLDDPLPLVVALLAGGAVGYAMLAVQTPALFVTGALFVLVFGWAWVSLFGYAVASRYPSSVAMATGIIQTGFFAGGVLGPLTFGLAVGAGTYALAWLSLALATLVAAASIAVGRRLLPPHAA